jgi:hypothetical protein
LIDPLLVSEFFGIVRQLGHRASKEMTMKKSLLTIGSILPLICVRQAKRKLAPTKNAAQGSGLGTIIEYRQWSLGNSPMIICVIAFLLLLTPVILAQQPTPIVPDPKLTPGDSFPVTAQDLCVTGYTKKVRHVPPKMKRQVYEEYGVTSHGSGDYEVDHLIPLELGGSNAIKNLWPESHRTSPWNAQVKDRLEGKLHALVCSGQLDLKQPNRPSPQTGLERINSMSVRIHPSRGLLRPPLLCLQ